MERFYKNYKKLLLIPIILLILSLFLLGLKYSKTGDFIDKDVSLKGGISSTIYTEQDINLEELKQHLSFLSDDISIRKLADFSTGKQVGVTIDIAIDTKKSEEFKSLLKEKINFKEENFSLEEIGSSLGESFYKEMLIAIIFALIFMAIVIFITFRSFIPSIAVVSAAILDLTMTLAIVSLFNFKISTAGIAAFLLLIGYSIDTDVLLTTKVLKRREGSLIERIKDSIKTGLTMTTTTMAALIVGILITNSPVLKQMFIIIFIGLVVDIISTYVMNASILIWFIEKNEKNFNS